MLNSEVQVAPFIEHPIVDYSVSEPGPFDIIAIAPTHTSTFITSGKFSLQQYCTCLLHKLTQLDKSDIKPFIQYQCEQLIQPFVWLNKFEKLIDLNRERFNTKDRLIKMEKALVIIELIRQEIQSSKFIPSNRFNFEKVKQKIKKYQSPEEQLSYLYEAQAEYLQNKPKLIDPTETPFDQKINIEIEKIERLNDLQTRASHRATTLKSKSPGRKLVIRGHINVLVDAFYQMLHEKKVNGLPYLDATATEITAFIAGNFLDKDGQPLSESTIRTILTPNKPDKRPKGQNKVNL